MIDSTGQIQSSFNATLCNYGVRSPGWHSAVGSKLPSDAEEHSMLFILLLLCNAEYVRYRRSCAAKYICAMAVTGDMK